MTFKQWLRYQYFNLKLKGWEVRDTLKDNIFRSPTTMSLFNTFINIIILITIVVTLSGCNTRDISADIAREHDQVAALKASRDCQQHRYMSPEFQACYEEAYAVYHPYR